MMKPSLLALSLAVATTRPFAAAEPSASVEPHAILDLSKDLELAPNVNESPGALAVLAVAEADPAVKTAMVIENGTIVASYVQDGVDPDEPIQTHSFTKSVTSLLYGILLDEGFFESVNVTLGEIFTDESDWEGVPDVESRKDITIKEMLTMTSGLTQVWAAKVGWFGPTPSKVEDYCNSGLNFLLRDPVTGPRGSFSYLVQNDILWFAFTKLTGMQPRVFLADRVLAPLGIEDTDIDWLPYLDCEPTDIMYGGLHLTAMQMAKIGLLHLARGEASPDKRVVSSDWIEESLTEQVVIEEYFPGEVDHPANGNSYGYQSWIVDLGEIGYACADGNQGQHLCVSDELGRVTVQQRDSTIPRIANNDENPAHFGMDPSLVFSIDADVENQPSAGSCATTNKTSWLVMLGVIMTALHR